MKCRKRQIKPATTKRKANYQYNDYSAHQRSNALLAANTELIGNTAYTPSATNTSIDTYEERMVSYVRTVRPRSRLRWLTVTVIILEQTRTSFPVTAQWRTRVQDSVDDGLTAVNPINVVDVLLVRIWRTGHMMNAGAGVARPDHMPVCHLACILSTRLLNAFLNSEVMVEVRIAQLWIDRGHRRRWGGWGRWSWGGVRSGNQSRED